MHPLRTWTRGAAKSGIKLVKLSLQMLIYQYQSFERSVHVAIAGCDDFLDGHIGSFGLHTRPLHTDPREISQCDWGENLRLPGSFGGEVNSAYGQRGEDDR